ncbi:hypothetical protein B5P41_32365 [Bacillus sp. SRB_28]|nr:hypothetical protein B5P41_32365 [Bacillus sp. SRB_28]
MSPINKNVGIAALSGKKDDLYLLRLYQLIRRKERKYFPTYEIEAFSFCSREHLWEFVDQLPKMSALEILMAMNPQPTMSH